MTNFKYNGIIYLSIRKGWSFQPVCRFRQNRKRSAKKMKNKCPFYGKGANV